MSFNLRKLQLLLDLFNIKIASQHNKFDLASSLLTYLKQELNLNNYHLSDSDKALLDKGSVLKAKKSKLYANILAIKLACQQHNMKQISLAVDNIKHDVGFGDNHAIMEDNKLYVNNGLTRAINITSKNIANGTWQKAYDELSLASMFYGCPLPKLENEIQEHNPKVLKDLDYFKKHSLDSFINKKFGSKNK